MKRKRPEQTLQIQVANYLRVVLRPPVIWTAIGHGGGGATRGGILKAMGLQAGWPDILVIWPMAANSRVFGIELKAAKGKMTPEQQAMQKAFRMAGAEYEVCKSIGEVQALLDRYLVPLHGRISA